MPSPVLVSADAPAEPSADVSAALWDCSESEALLDAVSSSPAAALVSPAASSCFAGPEASLADAGDRELGLAGVSGEPAKLCGGLAGSVLCGRLFLRSFFRISSDKSDSSVV